MTGTTKKTATKKLAALCVSLILMFSGPVSAPSTSQSGSSQHPMPLVVTESSRRRF